MEVRSLTVGPVQENCHIARLDGAAQAVVIDPGDEAPRLLEAIEALGVEGRVLQDAPNQDATGVLTFLARQKYDLVVMGTPDPWSIALVAPKYPDTRFYLPDMPVQALRQALVDLGKTNPQAVSRLPKNVQGTVFRAEEAGYLAGYLSGLMEERRPGRDVVGSVGGYDFEGVNRWIVGLGASC